MRLPNVAVYGSRSCEDTQRATRYLEAHQVAYEFKDVDETPEYGAYIAGLNDGKRVTPTIRINNAILVNPSDDALAQELSQATPVD